MTCRNDCIRLGKYEKAEATLNQARALNPKDPMNPTNLGALYFNEGDLESAAAGNDGSHLGEGSYRKAVNVREEALGLDPHAPRANFYLGTALYKIGEYERAESLLTSALAADKNLLEAQLSLLNLYIRQKRYDAALEQISAYLEANPDASHREQIEKFRTQIKNAMNQKKEF